MRIVKHKGPIPENMMIQIIYCSDDKGMFGSEVLVEIPKPPVPESISPRQFRLALVYSGVDIQSIDNMIETIEDENIKQVMKILREYSLSFERHNEDLQKFASSLGMDGGKLDQLFLLGSSL